MNMRIKTSFAIAAFLALALIGWLWSGQIGKEQPGSGISVPASAAADQVDEIRGTVAIDVQVRDLIAKPIERNIIANGKTAANRVVQLRGETTGRVTKIGPREGALVKAGDLLVTLDPRDREVAVLEAEAVLRQRQIELDAARQLNKKGFQAETNVALAEANYAGAEAALRRTELDLDHTRIKAPFDGVLEHRDVEIGDFVDIGEPIATILDLDPILVTGEVIETEVGLLKPGMPGTARLASGQVFSGTLRYVSSRADEQTRTFSIELEVPNSDGRAVVGTSAELMVSTESVMTHQVPSSVLSLGDDGTLGVKTVDETNTVAFMPVDIVQAEESSVWLTGLPDQVRVITVGQGFVRDGSDVRPVPETSVSADPMVSEVVR